MEACRSQYQSVCKDEFASIHAKLDRLDEALRGNGAPGIQRRLDRLETFARAGCFVAGLIISACVMLAVSRIFGG